MGDDQCCDSSRVCGEDCCEAGQECVSKTTCCPEASVCGSSCCAEGTRCCGEKSGRCCPIESECCGAECCTPGATCLPGGTCSTPQYLCVESVCTFASTSRIPGYRTLTECEASCRGKRPTLTTGVGGAPPRPAGLLRAPGVTTIPVRGLFLQHAFIRVDVWSPLAFTGLYPTLEALYFASNDCFIGDAEDRFHLGLLPNDSPGPGHPDPSYYGPIAGIGGMFDSCLILTNNGVVGSADYDPPVPEESEQPEWRLAVSNYAGGLGHIGPQWFSAGPQTRCIISGQVPLFEDEISTQLTCWPRFVAQFLPAFPNNTNSSPLGFREDSAPPSTVETCIRSHFQEMPYLVPSNNLKPYLEQTSNLSTLETCAAGCATNHTCDAFSFGIGNVTSFPAQIPRTCSYFRGLPQALVRKGNATTWLRRSQHAHAGSRIRSGKGDHIVVSRHGADEHKMCPFAPEATLPEGWSAWPGRSCWASGGRLAIS